MLGNSQRTQVFDVSETIILAIVAVILLLSAMPHLSNPYFFLGSVYSYGIVSPLGGKFVAMTLPMLQVSLGVCLLTGIAKVAALYLTAAMFGLFLAVQGWAWWMGLGISCGCFGASYDSDQIGLASMTPAVAGFALCVIGARMNGKR